VTPIEGRSVGHPATLAAALLASLVVALAVRPATADEGAAGSTPAEATADPTIWPSPEWPLARNEAHERRIDGLLGEMTIEEKVGQILQGDISTLTPDDVRDYHLGAVLSGGNSGPYGDDKAPPARWLELADELHAASVDDSDGGVAIPIVWGTDAVHGHGNVVGATLFPHNIGLGAMRDPDLIERIGQITALEIRATGQEWTFAPTVTVPQDFRWGRAYEGYSSDPALVSEYVGRMVTGLQGEPGTGPILDGPHVIASTKHFVADGGTENGTDQGDARIDETELRDVHGAPYVPAVEAGVATVMASFSSWNGVKVTGNRSLLSGVLKERMSFDGLLVSDWNAHGQIQGCTNESCPEALSAGIDMYMAPDTWKAMYRSLNAQVASGEVPMERLDDAVRRILRVKSRLGLFEAGKPSERPHAGDWSLIGAAEHRAVAREAVRKSLVLLKNESGLLPLAPGTKLLVAGDGADDIGRQCGGWTITWQGTGVDNDDFPGATSLWQGLSAAVTEAGGEAELAPEGAYETRPDAAVVVFGERPYAEFQGDLPSLQLSPAYRRPYETMRKLKERDIPVIAVMITGRPLFVNPELNVADDFVVAWLPGSEGAGVADLLVADTDGGRRFDFTGKLPADWPGRARRGEVLYPFGHGLSLDSPRGEWAALDEDVGEAWSSASVWFDKGVPTASWSLEVQGEDGTVTRVTTVPIEAAEGRVEVSATDYGVQEGARRFVVSKGEATIALSMRSGIELAAAVGEDDLLTFLMRVDEAPPEPPRLSMDEGDGADGVSLDALTEAEANGTWRTYAVPLDCFAERGLDTSAVRIPFRLTTVGPATLSLSRVALDERYDVLLDCP